MKHLLLLHGAIGAKDQLDPLAISLRSQFHVHTINFNGHGGSPATKESFSMEGFAHDVIKYLHENNITQVVIFGYSMGGYVAIFLARYYPEIVSKVITLATKFHWDETIVIKEIRMLDATTIEEKMPAFAKQLQRRHGINWKALLEKTKQLLLQLGNNNILQIADYACVSTPCLLLLGDKDKMVTTAETIAVYEALPNGKYMLLPHTSHPVEQVEVPVLAAIIEEFICQ